MNVGDKFTRKNHWRNNLDYIIQIIKKGPRDQMTYEYIVGSFQLGHRYTMTEHIILFDFTPVCKVCHEKDCVTMNVNVNVCRERGCPAVLGNVCHEKDCPV